MNLKKILILSILLLFFTTLASATPIISLYSQQAGQSYAVGTTLMVDFNIGDADNNRMTLDFNYSSTASQGTGTNVVFDLNLTSAYCSNQDWGVDDSNGSVCTYSWDTTGVPANCYTVSSSGNYTTTACNYYLLLDVNTFQFAPLGSAFTSGASYITLTQISTIEVNLSNFGTLINNTTTLTDFIMGGVKDQGGLIGLAVGLNIALVLLIGLIFMIIKVIPTLIKKVKRINQ